MVKFINTESRTVVTRSWGKGERGNGKRWVAICTLQFSTVSKYGSKRSIGNCIILLKKILALFTQIHYLPDLGTFRFLIANVTNLLTKVNFLSNSEKGFALTMHTPLSVLVFPLWYIVFLYEQANQLQIFQASVSHTDRHEYTFQS